MKLNSAGWDLSHQKVKKAFKMNQRVRKVRAVLAQILYHLINLKANIQRKLLKVVQISLLTTKSQLNTHSFSILMKNFSA
jgi:hypothetical protein